MIFIFLGFSFPSFSQELKYDPKGNPEKWNVELTPFFILPNVDGNIQSQFLSDEFGIGTADFISSLNGTFMMSAEVSKKKFFASPAYIYTYNEIDKTVWTAEDGIPSFTVNPSLKKNILEMKAGMRLRLTDQFILDPYTGFRYTSYHLFGPVDGVLNSGEIDEHADFWDPIIGFQAHFYPHPRVPVELRADIGGSGVGSEFTWSSLLNIGYSISPAVDFLAGFAALSNKYQSETSLGNPFEMTSTTYGFDAGVRVYIPARFKDPAVFKKGK